VAEIEILKTHGSKNDIFIINGLPTDLLKPSEVLTFVRHLCDRGGPFGADGVYFVDDRRADVEAVFFNPDGSSALLCGNGLRCVGRYLLDRRQTESAIVRTGVNRFAVRRGTFGSDGVHQIIVELPTPTFTPDPPIVAGGGPHVNETISSLHSSRLFTALAIPNSHLVAIVDRYDEAEIVAVGKKLESSPEIFPIGANVSFILPLLEDEVFVSTYERGAGLTPSCGSAVAAARVIYSHLGLCDPSRKVLIRNPGGYSSASLRPGRDNEWVPIVEGNATFVYRANIDPKSVIKALEPTFIEMETYTEEIMRYALLDASNTAKLKSHGIRASYEN
jgi:diaminopimelate epimerase